jgi:dienelactone hydrolase
MVSRKMPFGVRAALALLLLCGSAPAARAQLWLEPAYSNGPSLGPIEAVGAVIWSHGRSTDAEDATAPTPPYMATLRDGGWDTFRFNRMRANDTLAASARGLVEEVHKLKEQGYRRVTLSGQSFGGFLSLMAADASDEVDAVIATAPAAYGSFSEFYDSWRGNAIKLYPLLEQVRRARVMMFYFHGDDFDPGGRGDQSRLILAKHQIPYVVVDQPPQLTSHGAAATPQFAWRFGNCILEFLDAPRVADDARCDGNTFRAGTPEAAPVQPVAAADASVQSTATLARRTAAMDPASSR